MREVLPDLTKFREMVRWLRSEIKWSVMINTPSTAAHQVCLFGTGSIAADHKANMHLAQKYDKHLHDLMMKVVSTQDQLDTARVELLAYIDSRTDTEEQ